MAPDRVTGENITWVVGEHQRILDRLEARTEDLGVLRSEVNDLKNDMVSLRRALYTFAFSVAGGAVLFAVTVLQVIK